ncbi:hypothetical protein HQ29_00880 [Porphyromonas canoris]|nr:hypothetical protein HQ29_00880 [Porphyromonas canoris]
MKNGSNMKKLIAFLLCSVGLLVSVASCDEPRNALGIELQPDDSKIKTYSAQFSLDAVTVPFDVKTNGAKDEDGFNKILVSSPFSFIGHLPDEYFKSVSSDYLCQLYAPKGLKFSDIPEKGRIDSTRVSLYYTSYDGDSLAPLTIAAYKLGKTIPFEHYSVGNIDQYGPFEKLGESSFLPSVGNSRIVIGSGQDKVTIMSVSIPVDNKLGQDIYDRSVKNDPIFSSQEAFNKYFPGMHLTVQAGSGSMLRVYRTALTMYYTKDTIVQSSKKTDSLVHLVKDQELILTPEVSQIARFHHADLSSLLGKTTLSGNPDEYYTNLKSPAGVVTEITFPTKAIQALLKEGNTGYERALESVPLTLTADPSDNGVYHLSAPTYLLMLPKDSVASFFSRRETELTEAYTTFLSQIYSSASTSYSFSNISKLINKHIKDTPNEDLKVWVLPVERALSDPNSSNPVTLSISNLLKPTGLRLKHSKNVKNLRIIYSERKTTNK